MLRRVWRRLSARLDGRVKRPAPEASGLALALVAYIVRAGDTGIHSLARRDKGADGDVNWEGMWREVYSKKPADEYLAELNAKREPGTPSYRLVTRATALVMTRAAQEQHYITGWAEIPEREWIEACGVLPPEQWLTVNEVNIFRMCEYYAVDITWHYAKYDGKFFKRRCRITERYEELAQQVKEFAATLPAPA